MTDSQPAATTKPALVLVTGPSGAGRSSAINVLEDLGFETIDNLPLRLVAPLLDAPGNNRPLALGVDTRNRDFSTAALMRLIDNLSERADVNLTVLYLDCSADVLLRRFSETRRRHPMAPAEAPATGVQRELDLLQPVRERADTLIDTTDLNVHQFRAEMARWFGPETGTQLAISVQSFSYKRGLPRSTDMVFDCRFLRNPYWDPSLREQDGRDTSVQDYVAADARFDAFYGQVLQLVNLLLPAYTEEGKAHLSIAFGCTGGKHRSVTLAQYLAKALAEEGQQVSIRHRELERSKQG